MKTELINVTPAIAAEWIGRNANNRALRRTVVEALKAAFARGEYVQTHQGIAFHEDGSLLDGQHRLTAIAELRDGKFPMLVTTGVTGDAYMVMDTGVKRTANDSLRLEDRRLVETATLIAKMCTGRSKVTAQMLVPIIERIQRQHDGLMAHCSTAARTWSSVPVRLAAIVSIKNGTDVEHVRGVYRSMVLADFDRMTPAAQSLYRAAVDGRISASNHADLLARSLVLFDPAKANLAKVLVSDAAPAVAKVRLLFGHLLERDDDVAPAAPKGKAKA